MEKRRFTRIPVSIGSEFEAGGTRCTASVVNLSEEGVCVNIVTSHMKRNIDVSPARKLRLEFRLPDGEMISLFCRVKWSYMITAALSLQKVGMEILDPPEKYREFLKNLKTSSP